MTLLAVYLLGVLLWPQFMTHVTGTAGWARQDPPRALLSSVAWPMVLVSTIFVSAREMWRPPTSFTEDHVLDQPPD